MNRRKFLFFSLIASAGSSMLIGGCSKRDAGRSILARPQLLSQFCNEEAVRNIGKDYLKTFPQEKNKLTSLLLTSKGKTISDSSPKSVLSAVINENIKADFIAGRTTILRGWVISQTEARQCALFSIS